MHKQFMALLLCTTLCMKSASACDICGCGVSNYNPYLFPHLSKSYVGISYFRHLYHTRTDEGTTTKESYNSILLTGQYGIGKRLRVVAMVPYQVNTLSGGSATQRSNGLGDVTLLANANLWERKVKTVTHTVTGGIGMKLPTGRYTPVDQNKAEEQNFQLGTGSIDYLGNLSYRLAIKSWVVAANTSYKYNTRNSDGYRFGDIWTNSLTAIYRVEKKTYSLLPHVSASNEHFMKDADNHVLQDLSGGDVLSAGAGLDVNTRSYAVGLLYQQPLAQSLAGGAIRASGRFSAHVSITL
jgi:hypothetical protein